MSVEEKAGEGPPENGQIDAEGLRNQAEAIRERAVRISSGAWPGDPFWKRCAYLILVFLVVSGSLYLLIFKEKRRQLIADAGARWVHFSQADQRSRFHTLPPPQPKVERMVTIGPEGRTSGQKAPGILYETVHPSESTGKAPQRGAIGRPNTYVAPSKNRETAKAFELLKQKSKVAAKIVKNEISGFQFQNWKPLQARPPEYYIALVVASGEGSRELTWLVNLDSGETRPLSQEARDLEARFGGESDSGKG